MNQKKTIAWQGNIQVTRDEVSGEHPPIIQWLEAITKKICILFLNPINFRILKTSRA